MERGGLHAQGARADSEDRGQEEEGLELHFGEMEGLLGKL